MLDALEATAQDIADRMQNQMGKNAPYNINGHEITESDMPNGWPNDPDLSPQEVLAWLRARGSEILAEELEYALSQIGKKSKGVTES